MFAEQSQLESFLLGFRVADVSDAASIPDASRERKLLEVKQSKN